jgi:hypothetical protein
MSAQEYRIGGDMHSLLGIAAFSAPDVPDRTGQGQYFGRQSFGIDRQRKPHATTHQSMFIDNGLVRQVAHD